MKYNVTCKIKMQFFPSYSHSDVNSELLCTCRSDGPEITGRKTRLTELTTNIKSYSDYKNKNTYAWLVLGFVTLSKTFCSHKHRTLLFLSIPFEQPPFPAL